MLCSLLCYERKEKPVTGFPLGSVTGTATGATVVTSWVTGFPPASIFYYILDDGDSDGWFVWCPILPRTSKALHPPGFRRGSEVCQWISRAFQTNDMFETTVK